MRNLILITILFTGKILFGQNTTINILRDSLPNAGYASIEMFNNKLYTLPSSGNGNIYEIDTMNGNLTHVATMPYFNGVCNNFTQTNNFVFLNHKTIVGTLSCSKDAFLSVGLSSVDTLLKDHLTNGNITSVDTMAYIITQSFNTGSIKIFSTNLLNPLTLIDSNVVMGGLNQFYMFKECHSHKKIYYVINNLSNTPILKSTNGISKNIIETAPSYAYNYSIIGEYNSELYFTLSKRTPPSSDTTWLKKCDINGNISTVNVFVRSAYARDRAVVFGNKLVITFARETSPYGNEFIVYDLSTNSITYSAPSSITINANDFNQSYVGQNYFYFYDVQSSYMYISDGTVAGTKKYKYSDTPTLTTGAFNFDKELVSQTIGNGAIVCNDFPIVTKGQKLYFGNNNDLQPYQLFPNSSYNASHFEKIGNLIFFTARNLSFSKQSLVKLNSCNMPNQSPFVTSINEKQKQQLNYTIYPNPAKEVLNIKLEILNGEKTTISISNILGELVSSSVIENTNNCTINTTNLTSGVYFVAISNQGKQSTKKIIIE